ncbi:MAG: hypothetical protein IPJ65_27125 [Archangiaceae bacterium]|nr:hypothetical protein [Archangiaceae bacterium]
MSSSGGMVEVEAALFVVEEDARHPVAVAGAAHLGLSMNACIALMSEPMKPPTQSMRLRRTAWPLLLCWGRTTLSASSRARVPGVKWAQVEAEGGRDGTSESKK